MRELHAHIGLQHRGRAIDVGSCATIGLDKTGYFCATGKIFNLRIVCTDCSTTRQIELNVWAQTLLLLAASAVVTCGWSGLIKSNCALVIASRASIGQWCFERAHRLIILRHAADTMQIERNHASESALHRMPHGSAARCAIADWDRRRLSSL